MKWKPETKRRLRAVAMLVVAVLLLHGMKCWAWKTVVLQDCGTIKMPRAWSISVEDGRTAFYDESGTMMLEPVQYIHRIRTMDENGVWLSDQVYEAQALAMGKGIVSMDCSTVYSNSALLGVAQFICGDTSIPVYVLEFWGYDAKGENHDLCFVAPMEIGPYELKGIINSFVHN